MKVRPWLVEVPDCATLISIYNAISLANPGETDFPPLVIYYGYKLRNTLAILLSIRLSLCYTIPCKKSEQGEMYAY